MLTGLIILLAVALTAWITWLLASVFQHDEARKRFSYIEMLRQGSGASVTLLCDNEDAETAEENNAVDVNAEWTGWQDRRFYGKTLNAALCEAAMAMIRGRNKNAP